MIEEISRVKTVDVVPISFNGLKEQVLSDIQLPFLLKEYTQWLCYHSCTHCKQTICYDRLDNSKSFISGLKLISHRFKNEAFFEQLGKIFHLRKMQKLNTSGSYSYFVDENFGGLVSDLGLIDYYKCPFCHSQYVVAYMMRSREPNYGAEIKETNLYRILEVKLNEQIFLSEEYND